MPKFSILLTYLLANGPGHVLLAAPQQVPENSAITDTSQPEPDPTAVTPPIGKVPASIVSMGKAIYHSPYFFVMDKSTRTLSVWKNENGVPALVRFHPADFGKKPGDKLRVGDHRTPEGVYFFQEHLDASQIDFNEYGSNAYTLNYPNFFDRRDRKTGSGIWLHAIPETKTLTRGSRGCIVVRDEVIKTLGEFVNPLKTAIIVMDKVTYISVPEWKNQRQKLMGWLESWRKSWVNKDLETYMSFYHSRFRSLKMNKNIWRRYKDELNKKYEFIKVSFDNLLLLKHKSRMVAKFLQNYQSDKNADYGEKTLFVEREEDSYRILREQWEDKSAELVAEKSQRKNKNSNN